MQGVAKLAIARANELFEAVDRTAQKVVVARDKDHTEAGIRTANCFTAPGPWDLTHLYLAGDIGHATDVAEPKPALASSAGSIPFWSPSDDRPRAQAGTSGATLLPLGKSTSQSSVASAADATDAKSVASASPTTEDAADAVATAWDGNGGQHSAPSDTAAQEPAVGASAEVEHSVSAHPPQVEESTADQFSEHEDRGRSVARMTAMLAQLKAQLKQQAAENIQLEDMLKQADAQLSSASVPLRPCLFTMYST